MNHANYSFYTNDRRTRMNHLINDVHTLFDKYGAEPLNALDGEIANSKTSLEAYAIDNVGTLVFKYSVKDIISLPHKQGFSNGLVQLAYQNDSAQVEKVKRDLFRLECLYGKRL